MDWRDVVQISFVGGEPLLEKRNLEILERLLDLGRTDCFVSLVTNGSVELSQRQFDVLSRFKNLNICFSIDAVGEKFEYLRYPLKWALLSENLEQMRSFARYLSVSCMVSNASIFYLDATIDFFENQKIPYLCKQITDPSYFAPGNLPPEVKKNISGRILKHADKVLPFLQMGRYDEESFHKFWIEIDRQDQIKKIKLQNYLPELESTRIYDKHHIP